MASARTGREQAKADRRAAILRAAAELFAAQGFAAVTLEDLGAAVGVSGPAVYRHFAGKQALLAELLVGVSRRLHDGGAAVLEPDASPIERLRALIDFHVRFAVTEPDVIRVQDRDLTELAPDDLHAVRRWQREYVEIWVGVLGDLLPELSTPLRRLRVQAVFGLINSTPHSLRRGRGPSVTDTVGALGGMARAALLADPPD